MIDRKLVAVALVLAMGASSSHADPGARQFQALVAPCVAVMETEVLADLSAEDRKVLAGAIDTILAESLGRQKGIQLVDRQALDRVLAERASQAAGLTKIAAAEVAKELRPFWSAGVLICPAVRKFQADRSGRPQTGRELMIEVEAVLAQTGQVLGEAYAVGKRQGPSWDQTPALDGPLARLWNELPGNLQRAIAAQSIEIADVRLSSPLRRLQWMADQLGDSLRASLARPNVTLLRARHPLSTREERLLRVMGLSVPRGNDAAAGLACSPDFRLDAQLIEETGKDLDYDKTAVQLSLALRGREGPPARRTFSGMASRYRTLGDQAAAWLNEQLASGGPNVSEARDQEYTRQLASQELDAARQLEKLCGGWYGVGWGESGPTQVLRAKVLAHALRAAHLDPTSEEAARLVALGVDSPYGLRGDGRSSVCYDRVIAEGERYLERFGKSPYAEKVQGKIGSTAFQGLSQARQAGDGAWISLPYNPDLYRYAKVALLNVERDIRHRINMNLWAHANVVGGAVLGHCPPERLEEERSYWLAYWKKNVEPLGDDAPTWDFIDIFYYIRKKDCAGLRDHLNKVARRYPRSHQYVWWGTRPFPGGPRVYEGKPCWKARTMHFLRYCGDPQWETWEPSFLTEAFDWNHHAYGAFLGQFNPRICGVWDLEQALPLTADRLTIAWDDPRPADARAAMKDRAKGVRPLLSAGGSMWLCRPFPRTHLRNKTPLTESDRIWLIANEDLLKHGSEAPVQVQAMPWPPHPSDGQSHAPEKAVRCWLSTIESETPTVWIGTTWHGLARFDLREGKWRARWYTAKDGVPGEDILMVRPCRHQGKPKLLVLSQPQYEIRHRENLEGVLWALDPADGRMTLIAKSTKWFTVWPNNERSARYWRLTAVWKDGTKVPLCLYGRDEFPKLDAGTIVGLESPLPSAQEQAFLPAREGAKRHVWFMSEGSLFQFDDRMSPRRLLDAGSRSEEIFYYSPEAKGQVGSPGSGYGYDFAAKRRVFYPRPGTVWEVLQSPRLEPECCSSDPAVVWGCADDCAMGSFGLVGYRPATGDSADEDDAWYGPWRINVRSLDFIDGYLWLTGAFGEVWRLDPKSLLQAAKSRKMVRSTAQWRREFRQRLESTWRNAVRMHISEGEYDRAVATIAAARQTATAAPASHLALWEALARARRGDLPVADRLYQQVANDRSSEPFARGVALISLVNVRHAVQDGPGMNAALDQLLALFPGLAERQSFEGYREALDWYRQQAQRKSSSVKPSAPGSEVPSRGKETGR